MFFSYTPTQFCITQGNRKVLKLQISGHMASEASKGAEDGLAANAGQGAPSPVGVPGSCSGPLQRHTWGMSSDGSSSWPPTTHSAGCSGPTDHCGHLETEPAVDNMHTIFLKLSNEKKVNIARKTGPFYYSVKEDFDIKTFWILVSETYSAVSQEFQAMFHTHQNHQYLDYFQWQHLAESRQLCLWLLVFHHHGL